MTGLDIVQPCLHFCIEPFSGKFSNDEWPGGRKLHFERNATLDDNLF